eukprot:GILJ01010448.1.p1 GENE.GILJ01010448.1~~GILJ01010448.1.p1  ORF type:complete len:243 (+),score=24.36 GILJ01010448.1:71-730(+)
MAAKVGGRFFSIYDGVTEFVLGETLHQPAQPGHKGGYYVYASPQEALYADIPYRRGGLFVAPRVVLRVLAWGPFVIYDSGKLSFSYVCPVEEIAVPRGYLVTRSARRGVARRESVASRGTAARPPSAALRPSTATQVTGIAGALHAERIRRENETLEEEIARLEHTLAHMRTDRHDGGAGATGSRFVSEYIPEPADPELRGVFEDMELRIRREMNMLGT